LGKRYHTAQLYKRPVPRNDRKGIDLVGHFVVGVGNGLVSDSGIDQGHAQCFVSQHGGDGFEAHAPLDGLGSEGVPQLVGVHVPDPGSLGDPAEYSGDLVPVQRPASPRDQPVDIVITVRLVFVEELNQRWVQWDIPVVVKLPDRDSQPVPAGDERDGVGGQFT
jgi:hypothetical protein